MSKWFRRVLSAILALLIFAATLPGVAGNGKVHSAGLIYIICLSIIPFLLIFIFAGRNKILEGIGWVSQLILLFAVFTG